MRCAGCSVEATVLKSVICRDDSGRQGVLCDECWLPLADRLWIVPGPVAAFGRCRSCAEWFSARELVDVKPGGRRDAWMGTCRGCV